jgi:hypothetical protein
MNSRLFVVSVASLGLVAPKITAAQNGDQRPDVVVDAAMRTEAITNLAKEVDSNYVVPKVGASIAKELRSRLKSNLYTDTSARALAAKLTADLRALSHDPHFLVDYFVVPRAFPVVTPTADPVSQADRALTSKLQNFGFAKVERLAGNIGYIKLDRFEDPAVAGPTAAAAMQFVNGTDALIIDLRDNGGGYGAMVTLLASYFFSEETHLGDISGRDPKDLRQSWTYAHVPGPRYLDKPVYILSSPKTFSAAEAFAYDLRSQKRATIVGEKTRGGANTAGRFLLSSRFAVILPIGHVTNAVTGTNWEGGLKPDILAEGERTLPGAYLAALEATAPKHRDDPLTREIEQGIAALKSQLASLPQKQ